jgi:beta-lactam-binding protein with PASTA domain
VLERGPHPAGIVLGSDPGRGESVDKGSTVTLIVSAGPGSVAIDDVRTYSESRATKTLEKHGFKVTTRSKASDSAKIGTVITTSPRPGTEAKVGSTVTLVLSTGPKQVQVPSVVNLTRSSAQKTLEDAGFQVLIKEINSDQPVDQVITTSPGPGETVDEGSRVTMTVSLGPKKVQVPDVTGKPLDEARTLLKGLKFKVELQVQETQDETQDKVVAEQDPVAGTDAKEGDTVTLVVFKFKAPTQGTAP